MQGRLIHHFLDVHPRASFRRGRLHGAYTPAPASHSSATEQVSFPRLEQILRPYLSTASTRKVCTLETTLANNWKNRHQHPHRRGESFPVRTFWRFRDRHQPWERRRAPARRVQRQLRSS